ncbi:MAG: Holliday junction resolvase RuvX [Cytophagaceae bacterium]|nr:Holliday junction resolvase RuvX [Cytophagaceae bacterium]MDW8455353.1 Holliday junction resolvase RuvX [Cytophagaceae bacterium]
MPRIVSIDYGQKRSGIAVTDPLKIFATALATVDTASLITFLKDYHQKEGIEVFVVGMPATLSNRESSNTQSVKDFISTLQNTFQDIPVEEIDERFTTSMAFDTMLAGGVKKKARRNKALLDRISATIILQTYLELKNKKCK